MRFYTKQHKFYCGIDLHTNKMYLCILDKTGEIRLHQSIKTERELLLKAIHGGKGKALSILAHKLGRATVGSILARGFFPLDHCWADGLGLSDG